MDKTLKCLIVDDEAAAHYVLLDHMDKLDFMQISGQCFNAIEAINFLHGHWVDVVFLDINMPGLSGLEFLKTLESPPKIVLTTAYRDFALEGYEHGVSDYLLKPIGFQRFAKSAGRLYNSIFQLSDKERRDANSFIFLKVDRDFVKVDLSDIYYIQSEGNFARVFLKDRSILATTTTSELEGQLHADLFMRVHKSYIVALDKIERYDTKSVGLLGLYIPIGITYRREFGERMER